MMKVHTTVCSVQSDFAVIYTLHFLLSVATVDFTENAIGNF